MPADETAIRAAAIRIKDDVAHVSAGGTAPAPLRDAEALADAWLADHPADGAEVPTPDRLRAAAELVVATGTNKDWHDTIDAGALAVCRAWLADHPADGAEVPTPDRLRAAGFRGTTGENGWALMHGTDTFWLDVRDAHGRVRWSLSGNDGMPLPDLTTMAAVRAAMRFVGAANGGG